MFARLILLGFITSIIYILWVFSFPDFIDTYGNTSLNAKIREYKQLSLDFASGSENPTSLVEKLTNTSQKYINETKETYSTLENTVSGKIQDVKVAADSVEKAYTAINEAKDNINNVISTLSWTTK
jgi:flagellar hook-basal body complex protein FliE